jgi:hypothetical protein
MTVLWDVETPLTHVYVQKMIISWDVAPCSRLEIDRRFRGAYCLHHQGDESQKIVIFVLAAVRT